LAAKNFLLRSLAISCLFWQ